MKETGRNRLADLVLNHSGKWVLCDSDGVILDSNETPDELFGDKNEIAGRKCHEVLYGDTNICKDCPVLNGRSEAHPATRIGYNDESQILFSERIIPVNKNKPGEFILEVITAPELTILDKRLAHLENLAKIGQMSSGVAHDFNNILTSVLGQASTLGKLLKDDRKKEILANIEKAARSGAATAFRIKNFASSTGDKDHKPVDLNRLIEEVVAFSKPKWKEKSDLGTDQIRLALDLKGSIIVWGNEHELRNAFVNLIFNAIEAMHGGGNLKIKTSSKSGYGKVSIKDSGSGMDQNTLDNLFTPFYTTKGNTGTGLGLIECKSIVEGHNGSLLVESALGRGTTVNVRIPLSRTGLPSSVPATRGKSGKFHILVFDDQEYVLDVTKDLLEELGHTVSAWMHVKEGLDYLKGNKVDLVITDYGMKEMNGLEVAQEVKKFNKNIPVILMSGWVVNTENDPVMKKVINLSLPKPFSIQEMEEAVQRVMDSGQDE